ncbi:class III cytochrome C family protein [Aromatoleum toluvorans]|uniref:Class III cytochrome C family protein n=1 Tax=Aromatoleum toluvorans TaxID=92002 RepID=A0ABX1Q3T9_9RHOO|nr:cytochrome c3 family protein [Aromatoleum toluvorans]NMG46075.1 class III cytochrome C family protein [Aromatoleum toluvorans]
MSRTVKFILAANLAVLAVLTFAFPELMVGPGKLIPGHRELEADCFACHQSLAGASAERCITCHEPQNIGRLTSKGQPIVKPLTKTPFHQKLVKDDCVACHSDHAGVKRYRQQGRFSHALLQADSRDQCDTCHKSPTDALHQKITGNCGECHGQDKWVPATFDHDKFFRLDRDHNVKCVTCHERNDYSRYTCYGCHEHTPADIRREHIEEGIRKFDNCVECHVSADEHDIRGGRGEGGRGGRDDDD